MAVSNLLKFVMHWSGFGEEGSFSLWYSGSQASHSDAELSSALDSVDTALTSNETPSAYTNFRQLLYTGQTLDKISLYEYATAPGPATHAITKTKSLAGTNSAGGPPLQSALAVTLHTGAAGGRRRGRIFLPMYRSVVSPTTGLCAVSGDVDTYAGWVNQIINDVRQGLQTSLSVAALNPCVLSRASGSAAPVSSISIDNRFDTQRRREASLKPSYTKTLSVTVQ